MKPEIHARNSAWRSRPMPEPHAAIRVARRFHASPARVFDAWLDPAIARRWLFATATCPIEQMQIDARVGGSFRFVEERYGEDVNYRGEYTEIVPHRRLSFILATDRPAPRHARARRGVAAEGRRIGVDAGASGRATGTRVAHPRALDRHAVRTRGHARFARVVIATKPTKENIPCNTC